jgi:hypothetical protein
MPNLVRLITAGAFAAAATLSAGLAQAQDPSPNGYGKMVVGGVEISVGGGFATLDLPDIRFGTTFSNESLGTGHKFPNSNNFDRQFGPGITAGVVVPWSGPTALAVTGFFSNIDDKHTVHCFATLTTDCATVDPTGTRIDIAPDIKERTNRDVDNWGVQVEGRYYLAGPIMAPRFLRSTYLAAGGDVRAILQDTSIKNVSPQFPDGLVRYNETLDTHYYGGYLAIGGEYAIFPGLSDGLGLRSSFNAHVGIYAADTDYHGTYAAIFPGDPTFKTRLAKTDDEATVIGGLSFETRKQFGPRTSLSLLSEYEWYSYVPEMHYADGLGEKTTIHDDSALATRTTLRLNIGLGPASLYEVPPR